MHELGKEEKQKVLDFLADLAPAIYNTALHDPEWGAQVLEFLWSMDGLVEEAICEYIVY